MKNFLLIIIFMGFQLIQITAAESVKKSEKEIDENKITLFPITNQDGSFFIVPLFFSNKIDTNSYIKLNKINISDIKDTMFSDTLITPQLIIDRTIMKENKIYLLSNGIEYYENEIQIKTKYESYYGSFLDYLVNKIFLNESIELISFVSTKSKTKELIEYPAPEEFIYKYSYLNINSIPVLVDNATGSQTTSIFYISKDNQIFGNSNNYKISKYSLIKEIGDNSLIKVEEYYDDNLTEQNWKDHSENILTKNKELNLDILDRIYEENYELLSENIAIYFSHCPYQPIVFHNGKKYETVQIGNQCWFNENIYYSNNTEGSGNSIFGNGSKENGISFFSIDDITENKLLIPRGWKIPTLEEFKELIEFAENNTSALRYKGKKNLANGFKLSFDGYYEESIIEIDKVTILWTSSLSPNNNYYAIKFRKDSNNYEIIESDDESKFSIRCVKNLGE